METGLGMAMAGKVAHSGDSVDSDHFEVGQKCVPIYLFPILNRNMEAPESISAPADEPSHFYDKSWALVIRNVLLILAVVSVAGAFAMAFVRLPSAPSPTFRSDPDSMIIATKARLSREVEEVELGFVGDSSCLINIDVDAFEKTGGGRAVNLGTLSYLSMDSFGMLAGELAKRVKDLRVVLVVHPECVRSATSSEPHRRILEAALGQRGNYILRTNNVLASWMSFDDFRSRTIDRWIPEPLSREFGARYGFTEFIEKELIQRRGTLDETSRFDASTNRMSAEYRISSRIHRECEGFRSKLPEGTRLAVIISPVPRSHALRNHEQNIREFRSQLASWLGAESAPFELPSILPDSDFGTVTHLNPDAAKRYSRLVAERLASWRRSSFRLPKRMMK